MRILRHKKGNLETKLGRSPSIFYAGKSLQQQNWRMTDGDGESDLLIVLRLRESRVHGEGADKVTQLAKETFTRYVGLDK